MTHAEPLHAGREGFDHRAEGTARHRHPILHTHALSYLQRLAGNAAVCSYLATTNDPRIGAMAPASPTRDPRQTRGPVLSLASHVQVAALAAGSHPAIQRSVHPDPDCNDLLIQIIARVVELVLRADALIRDPLRLPPTGPMSIEGHKQQFRNKQVNLRSMLNQWDTNNCGDGYIPRSAWKWATRPVPSPAPAPAPGTKRVPIRAGGGSSDGRQPVRVGGGPGESTWTADVEPPRSGSDVTTGDVATVVGAGAAAYLVYRVLRFLPSLLPPLWWTVPANAAVP